MSFVNLTQVLFTELSQALFKDLRAGEELSLNLSGEDSLFVRFRNSMVRQNTQVEQRSLEMLFQQGGRRLSLRLDLQGQLDSDLTLCRSLLDRARQEVKVLPADPGATPFANRGSSQSFADSRELDFEEVLKVIQSSTVGTDFTGLLTSGPVIEANANSHGQRHWFSTRTFFLDYSLFTVNENLENKAVTNTYSGQEWSTEKFLDRLTASKNQLRLLKKSNREVKPGAYSVYMTPTAINELVGMFSWNAMGYGAFKKGSSALAKLADASESFSSQFTLRENFSLGFAPAFNSMGEVPTAQVPLIQNGKLLQFLTSTRSAHEYGAVSNYAETSESLRSPEIAAGNLSERLALKELGTGLYLGNLHYCNWSDLQTARVTGMTRYACFWVEKGEIVAPIRDLRFDESLYRCFGKNLAAVTKEQQFLPELNTYSRRALGGKLLPGMLIHDFNFTL